MRLFSMVFIVASISFVLIFSMLSISFGTASEIKPETNLLNINSSNETSQTNLTDDNNMSLSSLSSPNNTSNAKGTLIVKVTTENQGLGKNKSSDFLVSIHANEPVPSVFVGNANGTEVDLSMGMYSVSISFIPNYNSSFSENCYGGIMNIETKVCDIVNTYSISNDTTA